MKIIIIGAGPAGLMAAEKAAKQNHEVHIFDAQKRAGSKFLVAGKGGFNLTNSIDKNQLLNKFSDERIQAMVDEFDANDVRNWLESIRIPTYIGSSGKIFPMIGIKPIDVLNNWLQKLENLKVHFHYNSTLQDFTNDSCTIQDKDQTKEISFDKMILALGGASWKKTGSDGTWADLFEHKSIETAPFEAMNVGIEVDWDNGMERFAGEPLKNCSARSGDRIEKGELRITSYGLEGAPIYALTPEIGEKKEIYIDLKPKLTLEQVQKKLRGPKMNRNLIDKLSFSKPMIQMIRSYVNKETYLDSALLAKEVKGLKIPILDLRPIDEAISTRGGVLFEELNDDLALKKFPNICVIGEMLNWHAPTGGYLLQGCFSTGVHVIKNLK